MQVEGSEVYEKIVQLKIEAPDGKMRETDATLLKRPPLSVKLERPVKINPTFQKS